jgi:Uncharacterized protein conserved in bacteria (DUF2252)
LPESGPERNGFVPGADGKVLGDGELEVWYSCIGEEEVRGLLSAARARRRTAKKLSKTVQKARGRDSLQALS